MGLGETKQEQGEYGKVEALARAPLAGGDAQGGSRCVSESEHSFYTATQGGTTRPYVNTRSLKQVFRRGISTVTSPIHSITDS